VNGLHSIRYTEGEFVTEKISSCICSATMTAAVESTYHRGWSQTAQGVLCLEEKFEILKEIGDGSFGSVALARVRSAGAHVARRGTLVCFDTI
jgi:meiosis induction protein kinase IME2/SME1